MFVPPSGQPDDGKWAALPIGASIPSPSMIARSIPRRSIVMRFARMPASLSVVGWGDAAVAADPGVAVGSDDGDAGLLEARAPAAGLADGVGEAVACGTPVIVTDRCGIAPLIDQRAGLVVHFTWKVNSIEELIDVLT